MSRLSRRALLGAAGTAPLLLTAPTEAGAAESFASPAALETSYDVTLGLYAESLATGRRLTHRADTRFPMLSTFKTLATAAVLRAGVDLDEPVTYDTADVVENSPVTAARGGVMTYAELADAALRYSDNTAGNLLLDRIGGPAGLTRFARTIGDRVTRLDRREPDLNEALPGDERDTTTPRAIASSYRTLLLGDVLATRDRWLLTAWLEANTTSAAKFRTGLPAGWWSADKTGGGAYATQNQVALVTAPDGRRIIVAALTRTDDPSRTADPALMADVARLVVARLG